MPESPIKPIWLELQIDPNDPQLLAILDDMLQSGMLDSEQISQLARACLSTKLPIVQNAAAFQPAISYTDEPELAAEIVEPVPTIWQTLKDELSVRWLLFLGVFLVVLSSGVLAATQWSRFPAWGQYGLLWLYTIGFWLTGSWANKQEGLRLTANTLQIAALLLIPVNFWAIDSFGLWRQPWEIATAVVATSSLVGIAYSQTLPKRNKSRSTQWLMGAFIGLSCLQLGWQIPHWAAISIYIGSIGVAIILQKTRQIDKGALTIFGLGILILRGFFVVHLPVTSFSLAIGIVGWLFAQWGIQYQKKLQRVESIALKHPSPRINKHQKTLSGLITLYHRLGAFLLGLGWLIGLGELQTSPWQSMVVSGLALTWIWQRLQQDHRDQDLVWLFVVGMQAYILNNFVWRFISSGTLLAKILPWVQQAFGEQYLFAGGLLVFPYLLLWVVLTAWFWRRGQQSLCQTGEGLIMGTGLLATLLTIPAPLGLLIDLLATTTIFAHITHRHSPTRSDYLNLTHFSGLATVGATVYYRWDWYRMVARSFVASPMPESGLSLIIGSVVLTILAAIELCFSTRVADSDHDGWQRSTWNFGRGLAIFAAFNYFVLSLSYPAARFAWPLWWMTIPAAFTYVASRRARVLVWQQKAQSEASWWAIGGLAGTVLLVESGWRSAGLIVSVGLMFPIVWSIARPSSKKSAAVDASAEISADLADLQLTATANSRGAIAAAAVQIGFGLLLVADLLSSKIAHQQWLILGALVCAGLWFASNKLHAKNSLHSAIYSTASDFWAISLAGLGISIGAINYLAINMRWLVLMAGNVINPDNIVQNTGAIGSTAWFSSIHFSTLVASMILLSAMNYRQRWPYSANLPYLWLWIVPITAQIAWGAGIYLCGGNTWTLAVVNAGLALLLWLWQSYSQLRHPHRSNTATLAGFLGLNYPYLPGFLAVWSLLLRLPFFNNYTGLLSIGIGAILVISSRNYSFKLPAYGGLLLATLGCYELVTYQVLQAPSGGNIADALTIYGLVTAILALIYRSIVWLKSRQGATDFWDLSLDSLKNVAHAHWAIASTWKIAAAVVPPIPLPHFTILHLLTSGLLGIYALIQGRDQKDNSDWWVYLGLAELMGVGVYARSIFQGLGIVDSNLILVTCLIGLMLMLAPWGSWGWRDRPWRMVALVLPLSRVIFEWDYISLLNLAILATFYAGVARRQRQFGWAYLSLVFVNWAGMRLLWQYNLTSPIWYAVMVGLSILAVVQWDPAWQKSRQNRHYGRLAGAGVIAVTAIIWHVAPQPWVPIGLGVAIGAAGLVWRVRAWFYVGTITFLLSNFYQLVILITERPITKWAIGLFAGMLIIFLAANFEKRREQITKALQHWLDQLQEWQ
jgi:hypothetical protein